MTPTLPFTEQIKGSLAEKLKNFLFFITFWLQPCLWGGGGTGGGGWTVIPKMTKKQKVLRMGLPIVQSLSGLQESMFSLFRSPNSIFMGNLKISKFLLNSSHYPYFPMLGQWLFGVLGCC